MKTHGHLANDLPSPEVRTRQIVTSVRSNVSWQSLSLDDSAVKNARTRWEESTGQRRTKHSLSFDEFFQYFQADCVRYGAIGAQIGVSRERVRQIYNRYFRELFNGKNGKQRWHACSVESRNVKIAHSIKELLDQPMPRAVIDQARAAGCIIDVIAYDDVSAGRVKKHRLSINGHRCEVRASIKTGKGYFRMRIRRSVLEAVEAVLLLCKEGEVERLFVVPSKVLLGRSKSSSISFRVPGERYSNSKRSKTGLDFRSYENAWHLLEATS
jgi:hypothetical protein